MRKQRILCGAAGVSLDPHFRTTSLALSDSPMTMTMQTATSMCASRFMTKPSTRTGVEKPGSAARKLQEGSQREEVQLLQGRALVGALSLAEHVRTT